MFAGSHGEPYATFASRIGMAIPHEDAAFAQSLDELRMLLADPNQHKIRPARPVLQPDLAEFLLQNRTVQAYFRGVTLDIIPVRKSFGQYRQSSRIHVVRRRDAADHRHLLSISCEDADAQTRQPISFGESPGYKKVW